MNDAPVIFAAIGMALLAISMLIPRVTILGVIEFLIFIVLAVELHAIIPVAYKDDAESPISVCLLPWFILAGRIGWLVYRRHRQTKEKLIEASDAQ